MKLHPQKNPKKNCLQDYHRIYMLVFKLFNVILFITDDLEFWPEFVRNQIK